MNYSYEFLKVSPKQLFVQVRYFREGHPDIFRNIIVSEFTEESIDLAVQANATDVFETWASIENAPESLDMSSSIKHAVYTPPEENPSGMITTQDPEPEYDFYTQRIENTYEETETEARHGWAIYDLTEEEIAERLELGKKLTRQRRDTLLIETDYIMFSDTAPPTQEMLDYRQALRGVTDQEEFPVNVEWPEAPPSGGIPATITPRQARLALSSQGLLSQVQNAIDSLPESNREVVNIEWEYAVSIERSSPWITSLGEALGLTSQQLDDLFILGATL